MPARVARTERLSSFLSKRPLLSFVATTLVLATTTSSISDVAVADRDAPINGWTWGAGLLMAYGAAMVYYLPPRLPPPRRTFVRWTLAMSPNVYGWGAVMIRSPIALLWIGLSVSTLLLAWAAVMASREPRRIDGR